MANSAYLMSNQRECRIPTLDLSYWRSLTRHQTIYPKAVVAQVIPISRLAFSSSESALDALFEILFADSSASRHDGVDVWKVRQRYWSGIPRSSKWVSSQGEFSSISVLIAISLRDWRYWLTCRGYEGQNGCSKVKIYWAFINGYASMFPRNISLTHLGRSSRPSLPSSRLPSQRFYMDGSFLSWS